MKQLVLWLVALMFFVSLSAQTAIAPSEGDGSSSYPYRIASLDNLCWIAQNPATWSSHFRQTADIDASQTATWYPNGSDAYYGWSPIGVPGNGFSGVYIGDGFHISGLYINRPTSDYQGLFGYCNGAAISDLFLVDSYVKGQTFTGGLAGELTNGSEIINCGYDGIVHATWQHSGGLVGYLNGGTMNYCSSSGNVNGSSWLGGLAGSTLNGAVVSNCYSRASVSGNGRVGGLIGNSTNDTVSNSYSAGLVIGFSFTGGLIGEKSSGITSNCFWDVQTSLQATSSGDGATGLTTAAMTTQSTFTDAGWNFLNVWATEAETNDGYPYLIWGQIIAPPNPPENVAIIQTGDDVQISWDEVIGATSYKIYSCSDPYGVFEADLSGTFDGTNWTAPAPDTRRFYDVRAVAE